MAADWKAYQEAAAAFFRTLGADAKTNVRVKGVRTHHDIDVRVRSHHIGFDVTWLVECKRWQTRISKLHVLALREIVADVGADRGVILSEVGFQSGALEAAALTNVHATSLATLRRTASAEIVAMRLRELFDRVQACKERYWDIPKRERIERGLRADFGEDGYSGRRVIEAADDLLTKAFLGTYPVEVDSLEAFATFRPLKSFATPDEILAVLDPLIGELEKLLDAK